MKDKKVVCSNETIVYKKNKVYVGKYPYDTNLL